MNVSLDDFAKVLGDEAGFSRAKKLVDHENSIKHKNLGVVDVPLPDIQQSKATRQMAYKRISQKVGRWTPLIKRNREAKHVSFREESISSENLLVHQDKNNNKNFEPKTLFEKEFQKALVSQGEYLKSSEEFNPFSHLNGEGEDSSSLAQISTSIDGTMGIQKEKTIEELSKERSMKFFQLKKQAHQSKIKSKSYHKHLKKSKIKSQSIRDLEEIDDKDEDEERKIKAETNRAKERLTLKTRQASLWARDIMQHRNLNKNSTQFSIIREQLETKERLRQEIMLSGAALQEDDDENSEDQQDQLLIDGKLIESEDDDEEEMKNIKKDKSSKRGIQEKGLDFGNNKKVPKSSSDAESNENENENISEPERIIVGRRRFGNNDKAADKQEIIQRAFEKSEDDELDIDGLDMLEKSQDEMRKACNNKGSLEGEKVILPGWGSWAGAGMHQRRFCKEESNGNNESETNICLSNASKNSTLPQKKQNQVRLVFDGRENKVFINKLTIPKISYPYKSKEEVELANREPIGLEWNSMSTFQRRTRPQIQLEAGTIINPIKYVKLEENEK